MLIIYIYAAAVLFGHPVDTPVATDSALQVAMPPQPPPVIVVGAGLAGLAASFAALRAGAHSVVLLEESPKPGGNSIKASSGINGAPTKYQTEPDTSFFSDTTKSAGKRLTLSADERPRREKLISLMTNSSKAAIDFLVDDVGVDLSVVAPLGGHSVPRTHRGAGKRPPGVAIVMALLDKLKEDERFELKTTAEVTRLLLAPADSADASKTAVVVDGVEHRIADGAGDLTTLRGPVVFATGGFAGDWDSLAHYRPDLTGIPSSNEPRRGMHSLLTAVGSSLVDMDSVQIHPTGFVDPADPTSYRKFLAAELLRGEGGILLHEGKRFVNEMGTREDVSNAIMALPHMPLGDSGYQGSAGPPTQWDIEILLDPGACDAAAEHVAFYIWKKLLVKKKVKDLDETTRETVRSYSAAVAANESDPFGKSHLGHWRLKGTPEDDEEDVCVGRVTPIIHFTMGGVVINEKAQVLTSSLAGERQEAVQGLWAAGEVTGGIHGDNRLGGSSLLECVVFGLIAGEQAAEYAKPNGD